MMSDDRLAEWLREADAWLPPSVCSSGLADRVHASVRRRRAVRWTAGAVAAGMALMAGTYLLATGSVRQTNPAPVTTAASDAQSELAEIRAEIARLRAEIDVATRDIRLMGESRKQDQARSDAANALLAPTPAERLETEFDKTAFIMVRRGDLMYRTYGLVKPALESYRRAIELFPDSRWADVARERLHEIEKPKGDQL